MIVRPAIIMDAKEIISAILTTGVLQVFFVNLRTATVIAPTKLVATKNTKLEI
jgi:hypothetical protein